ncbi:hypothetical protein [Haematobacter sp. UBA3484]|nr:hypothetical protein [Haematobacter sp. UBA3484]
MPNLVLAAYHSLPAATLAEIHDLLTLALDAGEKPYGYTDHEREVPSTCGARALITGLLDGR